MNKFKDTALLFAVYNGNSVVKSLNSFFLLNNESFNAGHEKIVNELIRNSANVNKANENSNTALHLAVYGGEYICNFDYFKFMQNEFHS